MYNIFNAKTSSNPENHFLFYTNWVGYDARETRRLHVLREHKTLKSKIVTRGPFPDQTKFSPNLLDLDIFTFSSHITRFLQNFNLTHKKFCFPLVTKLSKIPYFSHNDPPFLAQKYI